MNNQEQKEIRDYLQTKKLSLELFIEVEDHFCSQIQGLMLEEDLSFAHAFEKVKYLWKDELKMTWDGNIDLEDRCNLQRKDRKAKWKSFLKPTLKYGTIIFAFILLIYFLLPENLRQTYLNVFFVIAGVFPLVSIIYYWKSFRILRKHQVVISEYQSVWGILAFLILVFNSPIDLMTNWFDFLLSGEKIEFRAYPFAFIVAKIIFLTFANTMFYFVQKKLFKSAKVVEYYMSE